MTTRRRYLVSGWISRDSREWESEIMAYDAADAKVQAEMDCARQGDGRCVWKVQPIMGDDYDDCPSCADLRLQLEEAKKDTAVLKAAENETVFEPEDGGSVANAMRRVRRQLAAANVAREKAEEELRAAKLSLAVVEGFHDAERDLRKNAEAARDAAQGALCRAKEVLTGIANAKRFDRTVFPTDAEFVDWAQSIAGHVISQTSPCPHDLREKALEEVVEWAIAELESANDASPVAPHFLADELRRRSSPVSP